MEGEKPRGIAEVESAWVQENMSELRVEHGGKWIAVIGQEVVAVGEAKEIRAQLDEKGLNDPYVCWLMPEGEDHTLICPGV